jgi:hypothetical protein
MSRQDLGLAALAAIFSMALATAGSAQNNSPTLNQAKQTNTANTNSTRGTNSTGTASGAARSGFDTAPKVAPPVQANVAPKPSAVGLPVRSTATTQGFKPAAPPLHINPVPSPVTTRTTSTAPVVARSTTTVSSPPPRPVTTTTAKKP